MMLMSEKPLAGKKIAVLVESQYIAAEIRTYQTRFAAYGAEVHLMTNLQGKNALTFVSEVETPNTTPETLEVTIDFQKVNLDDYAAVLMCANYVSVRLRYFTPPNDADNKPVPIKPEMVKLAPAVQFFSQAMRNPNIIKGALCHALWILTPMPDLLTGRKVICHEVVLADIINAGANYRDDPSGIVVDGDLVTGHSYHEAAALAERIKDLIVAKSEASLLAPV
jgi:protease I